MTKSQFRWLTGISVVLAALLAGHLWLVYLNNQLSQEVSRQQASVNNGQQLEVILDRLAKRIAQGSEKDPRLKNILSKHGLQVTLEVDGKQKKYP
jgi:hypothetical protein